MQLCNGEGFAVHEIAVEQDAPAARTFHLSLQGRRPVAPLLVSTGDTEGVVASHVVRDSRRYAPASDT